MSFSEDWFSRSPISYIATTILACALMSIVVGAFIPAPVSYCIALIFGFGYPKILDFIHSKLR